MRNALLSSCFEIVPNVFEATCSNILFQQNQLFNLRTAGVPCESTQIPLAKLQES